MTAVILLWVMFGGALGAGARYLVSGWIAQAAGETFPLGTLVANVTGSFLIVIIAEVSGPDSPYLVSPIWRQFLMLGVLGGFTTFSSFSLQTLNLVRDGELGLALLNVTASVVLCLLGAWLALITGSLLIRS